MNRIEKTIKAMDMLLSKTVKGVVYSNKDKSIRVDHKELLHVYAVDYKTHEEVSFFRHFNGKTYVTTRQMVGSEEDVIDKLIDKLLDFASQEVIPVDSTYISDLRKKMEEIERNREAIQKQMEQWENQK